jgi:hypothetical protein
MPCSKPTNYRCIVPRRQSYSNANDLKLDLRGGWASRNPQGASCEIMIDFTVELSSDCIALGRPVTAIEQINIADSIITLSDPDGSPLLTFAVTNLDALLGVDSAKGYELERVDVEPFHFWAWEGTWTLQTEGSAVCDFFVSARIEHFDHVGIVVPQDVSFSSRCISPNDADSLQFSVPRAVDDNILDNRRTIILTSDPVLIPRWVSWSYRSNDLIFRDVSGAATVFKFEDSGSLVATIQRRDAAPFQLYMKRATARQ